VVFPELLGVLQVHLRAIDDCADSVDKMDETYLCVAILSRLLRIMERPDNYSPDRMFEMTVLIKDILNVVQTLLRSVRTQARAPTRAQSVWRPSSAMVGRLIAVPLCSCSCSCSCWALSVAPLWWLHRLIRGRSSTTALR
jgi:hypothetical protein